MSKEEQEIGDFLKVILEKMVIELALKGHAIVKVNDEQVGVVKNNILPAVFYGAPLADLSGKE